MAALSCGAGTGGMLEAAFGGMTDASKRRLPDDDEDWEAVEGQEPLASMADVAAFFGSQQCGASALGAHGRWAFYSWTKGFPYRRVWLLVVIGDPRW